jgi:hypothetical protein
VTRADDDNDAGVESAIFVPRDAAGYPASTECSATAIRSRVDK